MRVEMAARGRAGCMGRRLVEQGPAGVFSRGKEGQQSCWCGARQACLVDCKQYFLSIARPNTKSTDHPNRNTSCTPIMIDGLSPPASRPGCSWRHCQFQPPRSRSPLEDYSVRIDKHVRDTI